MTLTHSPAALPLVIQRAIGTGDYTELDDYIKRTMPVAVERLIDALTIQGHERESGEPDILVRPEDVRRRDWSDIT